MAATNGSFKHVFSGYSGAYIRYDWKANLYTSSNSLNFTVDAYLVLTQDARVKVNAPKANYYNTIYTGDSGSRLSADFTFYYSYNENSTFVSGYNQPKTVDLKAGEHFIASATSDTFYGNETVAGAFTSPFEFNFQDWSCFFDGTLRTAYTIEGSNTIDPVNVNQSSTVRCTTAYIGEYATITITPTNYNNKHTLIYEFGDLSSTIVSKTTLTSIQWLIPGSFLQEVGSNTTKASGTLTCITYNSNNVEIGQQTTTFSVLVDVSLSGPSFNPILYDTNTTTYALTGNDGVLVKYFSTAYIDTGAKGQDGATITSQTIENAGKKIAGSAGSFQKVESNKFMLTATDSRGMTSTTTVTSGWIEYTKLTCNLMTGALGVSGDLLLTITGNYFNSTFGSQYNSLALEYRYKADGDEWSDWVAISDVTLDRNYRAETTVTGLAYKSQYTFQARAQDALMQIASAEQTVVGTPVFDWGKNSFTFHVPVTFEESIILPGNNVLWSGASHMNGNQSAVLSDAISNQPNGIVLVFSLYRNGAAEDVSINSFFVSKKEVELLPGAPHTYFMNVNAGFSMIGAKYLYIYDNVITGHESNTSSSANSGITFNNSNYVLRYVIGV